ncbi:MAG: ABC transporter substrate-binding protein [Silicimonas sp.]|nr:ABC transporter substrate-binding protein [Silicimonas sp.]
MDSDFSRRSALICGASGILALSGLPALALTTDEAASLINKAVGDINKVINSGKSAGAMYGDFERIFRRYGDVPTIARSALGPPARSASSAQMRAFTSAFSGYMARKYGKRFREFIGGQIKVTDARKVKSFQEVRATAKLQGRAPFAVSFMVSDRSGTDKFFDLLIEGISLLKSERAEIGAMLDKRGGNIDKLIADLKRAG